MSLYRPILIIVAAFALLTACGGQDDSPTDLLGATVSLPAPSDDVVLTIRDTNQPDGSADIQVDLAGIESLGTTTIVINEPFVNQDLQITGVPVDALLAAAGVDPEDSLAWTALDDYQVYFNRQEAAAEDALLATRIEGEPIDIADGGPVRIMFLDSEGPLGRDTNQWIWSLNLIEIQ